MHTALVIAGIALLVVGLIGVVAHLGLRMGMRKAQSQDMIDDGSTAPFNAVLMTGFAVDVVLLIAGVALLIVV